MSVTSKTRTVESNELATCVRNVARAGGHVVSVLPAHKQGPGTWLDVVAQYPEVSAGERDIKILGEIHVERREQDEKWGEQNHPDGTDTGSAGVMRDMYREDCQAAFRDGEGTWRHILREEIYEAFAESDPAKLRAELIQSAAVIVAWIAAIDRRVE